MKCFAITKKLRRCKNKASFIFCPIHRIKWWSVIVIIGVLAGLYHDLLKPLSSTFTPSNKSRDRIVNFDSIEPDTVYIMAGSFKMGINKEDFIKLSGTYQNYIDFLKNEIPQKEIKLNAYYISKYEITNREYRKFVEDDGYPEPDGWKSNKFKAPDQPVVGINWSDADNYCKWLSKKTGKKYRLPYEEEWEYAAKGNDNRTYPWGNEEPSSGFNVANFGNKFNRSLKIDEYPSNTSYFKVVNMAGNVAEWCMDTYKNTDLKYNKTEFRKVVRGGSWEDDRFFLRCTARNSFLPGDKKNVIGFRIVRQIE